jgi:hypothetical protein
LPAVFRDSAGAVPKRVDRMHRTRYIEIFLAARDPGSGQTVAACYNTLFTSRGIPGSKDTAPQALVERLDFEGMKKAFGVLGASLNGPKLWLPDWTEIPVGRERDFDGITAAWVAQLNMSQEGGGVSDTRPYAPFTIERAGSSVGWNKGTKVVLLDDAAGNTWIMKGFQQGLKPRHTYEQFLAAGAKNFRRLPPGWKVRIKTLDRDLVESVEGSVATIMADEFFNVYDKTDPGMMNYTP